MPRKIPWGWSTTSGTLVQKPHAEIHELCRASGLAGIEGVVQLFDGKSDAELETIGGRYRAAGVEISSFHLPFRGQNDLTSFYETVRREAVREARIWMERSVRLGAKVGIQHPSTSRFGVLDEGLDKHLRALDKSLKELLPAAERLGYRLALENMLPGKGERFGSQTAHFERIAKEFEHPNLGFCLDTGHALVALGPDRASEMFEAMGPRLAAFHLADNAGDRDSHLAPGHGLVDWKTLFQKAAALGFSGRMCIETPPFAHGPDYAPEAWRRMVADTAALAEAALAG